MSPSLTRAPIARPAGLALAVLLSAALAGCSTFGGDSGSATEPAAPSTGSSLANYFKFGQATPPEPAPPMVQEELECPAVDVLDGAAALRQGGPEAELVRSQLSITNTARECRASGDQIVIKVGVEGRALLGPAGKPGTYTAPVRIVAKRGDKVLVSRLVRQSVAIPGGVAANAPFIIIEDNIVVPKEGAELTLLVGFDEHGGAAATPRRKRG
jgi:hypothetical protein